MKAPRYSFVVPMYNEAEVVRQFYSRLSAVMAELDGDAEVIFVDDGSTDETWPLLAALHESDPRVKVIRFARNFGHQLALSAGLDVASGDAVVVMDGDLQDPPEAVPDLIERWKEGYDVVYAVRERRLGERRLKTLQRQAYYRFLRKLAGIDIPVDAADFRLIDRQALNAFLRLRERNRYMRGMFSWIGFKQIGVPCDKAPRYAGTAKYSYRKLARLALDGIVSFSEVPLRAALGLGLLISFVAFALGVLAIITRLAGVYAVPGWASLVVVISLLGGIQLLVLGMMGLYIGRIYEEVKARPLYIIQELHGFSLPLTSAMLSRESTAHLARAFRPDL